MVIIKVEEREKEQRSSFNFRAGPTLKKLRTQRIQAMTNKSKELAAGCLFVIARLTSIIVEVGKAFGDSVYLSLGSFLAFRAFFDL